MILALDTETTGLPAWSTPSDDPCQPHVIQIAALLVDDAGTEVESLSTIVQPGTGAVMEPEAFKAHGISLERALAEGAHPVATTAQFIDMADRATLIVGHNISFDIRLMRIMAARHLGHKWESPCPSFCTMKRSSSIVDLPPTEAMVRSGRNWPKPPKLEEAIRHFFDEGLDGAHDALVDVRASLRLFFHLTQEHGVSIIEPVRQPRTGRPAKTSSSAPFSSDPFAAARAAIEGVSR